MATANVVWCSWCGVERCGALCGCSRHLGRQPNRCTTTHTRRTLHCIHPCIQAAYIHTSTRTNTQPSCISHSTLAHRTLTPLSLSHSLTHSHSGPTAALHHSRSFFTPVPAFPFVHSSSPLVGFVGLLSLRSPRPPLLAPFVARFLPSLLSFPLQVGFLAFPEVNGSCCASLAPCIASQPFHSPPEPAALRSLPHPGPQCSPRPSARRCFHCPLFCVRPC